jgi:8-oxo-dGTP diphosphatase
MKLRNMTSVYLTGEQGILCLYRVGSRVVSNRYIGSAGGHFEPEELNDPRTCVLRELKEELGLTEADLLDLRLRYITHRYMAGEIRQNYYYFAKLREEKELISTEGDLRWIKPEEFADLPMPISAKHMILHYLRQGKDTDLLYGGITRENRTDFVPMLEFEG